MFIDWSEIKINIREADTRCMRPDTMGEKLDDALLAMFNDMEEQMYASPDMESCVSGLAAWLS